MYLRDTKATRNTMFTEFCLSRTDDSRVDSPKRAIVSRSLLAATLDQHGAQLLLVAFRDVNFQQLVCALFEIERRHNREVDGASQVDQIHLRGVFDLHHTTTRTRVSANAAVPFWRNLGA